MRKIKKKSFDWYGTRQHFSIRKYHFGAASVLLGMSLAVGTGTTVQAEDTVVASESLASSTTVVSSTESTPSSETSPATSTETSATVAESVDNASEILAESTKTVTTSPERKATINYIIQYITEDGSLVDAALQTITIPTTDAVGTATVGISLELPAGYELASGQSASLTQEVTEGAENVVTVKVVKKAEATATTATSETTTIVASETATATEAVAETVKTPATVEEAKVVLEQNISEAQVLSNEASRLYATTQAGNESLKTAADATQLAVTEANAVLTDSLATLEQVNAQINAVRANVEALAVEFRKFSPDGEVSVALFELAGNTAGLNNIGDGLGTLIKTDTTVSAPMTDANGASVSSRVQSPYAPTAVEGYYTLNYMSVSYYDAIMGYDRYKPYGGLSTGGAYFRTSIKSPNVSDPILVELVAKDGTLLESHYMTPNVSKDFTHFQATSGVNKPMTATIRTDVASDTVLGQIFIQFDDNTIATATDTRSLPSTLISQPWEYTTYYKTTADTTNEALATYTIVGVPGNTVTPSGVREFGGYEYVNTTTENIQVNQVAGVPYVERTRAHVNGTYHKSVATPIGTDGSLKLDLYFADPNYAGTPNFEDTSTEGFIKIIETQTMGYTQSNTTHTLSKELFDKYPIYLIDASKEAAVGTDKGPIPVKGTRLTSADQMDLLNLTSTSQYYQITFKENPAAGELSFARIGVTTPGSTRQIRIEYNVKGDGTETNTEADGVVRTTTYKGTFIPITLQNQPNVVTETTHWYRPVIQEAIIRYQVEGATDYLEESDTLTGNPGTDITYSTEDTINKYKKLGYELVSDNFTADAGQNYDYDTAVKQEFLVVIKPRVVDVPKTVVPGDPVDPTDPNSPVWPATVENLETTQEVTRTVEYKYEDGTPVRVDAAGNILPKDSTEGTPLVKTETVTFTRPAQVNLVTGEVTYGDWVADTTDTLSGNQIPAITDYTATRTTLEGVDAPMSETVIPKTVAATDADINEVVYYTPNPKYGDVVVNYVNTDGKVIATPVVDTNDALVGTDYSTADQVPEKIVEDATGDVYYYKEIKPEDVAKETGTVVEGTTEVTYVYEKAGDVVIKYVDVNGVELQAPVADTTAGKPGSDYNTAEGTEKPATITTADGKVYALVPAGDYPVGTVAADSNLASGATPTGTVETGVTKEVTYVYQEVKSDVVVEYYDTAGNPISGTETGGATSVVDTEDASVGTAYNTEDKKPATITAADGTVYYYKEVKDTSAPTTGKVAETTTTVQYVYEKAGSVNVNYVDVNGNEIKADVLDVENGQPGSNYDTVADNRPDTIVATDGKTYKLVPAGDYPVGTVAADSNLASGDAPTGTVEAGVTKEVTYVYQEVKGNVMVHYVDQNGNPISGTTDAGTQTASSVEDTPASSTGTEYNTTDLRPNTITTADGKIYKLVPAAIPANETGKVVEGTTNVTYVYELVQGDVVVHYVDTEGNTIAKDVTDTKVTDTGTDYDTRDNKQEKIIAADGTVYYILPQDEVQAGSAPETGKVVEGTTEVTYVYQKAGDVVIKYVDVNGTELKAPVADITAGKPGSDYNTAEGTEKPTTITTADGKVYALVPAGDYPVGTVAADSNLASGATPTGTVEAGVTKEVTYVYQEVVSDVVVEYYDTEGNVIAKTVTDTNDASVGTVYNTDEDNRPETITAEDGTVYYYKEVKDTSAPTTGTVAETTTTVQYVYEKAGNVVVNYITEDGTVIKTPVNDETNAKPGTEYNTTDNKPTTITTEDGKTYELIPTATIGNETGNVEAGKTTEVTYVYKEVKGSVVVNYVTTDGTVIKDPVTDTPETSTGTPYDTTDVKSETITTADGKTYKLVPSLTKGSETGDVVPGVTEVTYVYEEVKGDVVVNYVNTAGEVIAPQVVDTKTTSTGTAYDTTDNKPAKITTEDGTVYYYKEVDANSATETGKVVEGTTEITYVYEQAGNVVVNYTLADGTVIKTPVKDETSAKPGSEYNTTDNKPETITTEDGKTYKLVPSATIGNENGTVEAGKTTEVTYIYEEVKGNVVVEYYNTAGEKIATDVEDTPASSTGTAYSTLDNKPTTITAADGTVYYYKEVKADSAAETGDVVEGTTTVKYVYEPAGSVTVNYVTTDGTVIKSPVKDEENAEPGKTYSTEDNKPTTITTEDGKTYKLVPSLTTGEENGSVTSGDDKQVTYVYEEVKGNVVVNYIDTEGNVIKAPVTDTASTSTGTAYDTTDNKPETITYNGEEYKLVPVLTKGEETGSVVEGTTQITYVYQKVTPAAKTGNVVVEYYNTAGEKIADDIVDTPETTSGTVYETLDFKPTTITKDGVTYFYKEVKDTSAAEKGTVVEGTTTVQYVYEPAGSVTVNYVTTDGTVIKTPVKDEENAEPGKTYSTEDNKPTTITTEDGKTYKLVPSLTTGEENGTVTSGEDKQVTYVYEEVKGDVVVNYIDTEGNVIKAPVTDTPSTSTGTAYDTTDNKPETITTEDGTEYKLVPVLTKGEETGSVVEGTTQVTYVYQKVTTPAPDPNGSVVVNYVNTNGETIATSVNDTTDAALDTAYDTTDYKPAVIKHNGVTYYYKEVKAGDNETGKVKEGTTEVTYIYEPAGSVTVNYVTTDGTPIKTPVKDEENAEPGKTYSTEDNKPTTITTEDGKTYKLVPSLTTGEETGTVTSGEDKQITYVYEEITGDVVVNYIDTEGNVIKTPVTDTPVTSTGTDYDTTDNKPTTITTEDGSVYELVPVLTKGAESGKVVAGTTQVTYVYRKVSSPTPVVQTGNVVVEYYNTAGEKIAEDVVDTPETAIGTVYETLEYKPDIITKEGVKYFYKEVKDTSATEKGTVVEGTTKVQYVYEPAGSVTVNYVTTDGTVIKTPVKDEENAEPGKTYSTEDQKPTVITTEDGKTYQIVPKLTTGEENGTVASGEDKQVTYVYEEVTGDVVVNYIDTEGNVIKAPVTDTDLTSTGTAYDTTDNKPTTITTEDGSVYELVPVLTKGEESGKVVAGTTQVTYVYRKVSSPTPVVQKGTVVVEYYNTAGEKIAEDVVDTPETAIGTVYETLDYKPTTITKDGVTYFYKELKDTSATEKGTVVEGTTTVQYVYEPAGSVTVNFVTTDGTVIKSPVKDEENAEPGKTYSTEEQKIPVITTEDGKTYKLVPSLTTGEENGTITSGEDKQVTYVYEEVTGDVVVNYIDTEGNVIKAPVTDTPTTSTGTAYDTTDNKLPTITTEDGSVYELVPVLTQGEESGRVTAGSTQVTYVYRKVVTPTPDVKTGSVVIRYVEAGNESNVLKDPVLDENAVATGTKYDTTDEGDKPTEIVKDGVRYVLVPSKTTAVDPNGNAVTETGEVAEGTTIITYKYHKVANWIPQIPATPENPTPVNPVIPYPIDPTNPEKPIDPTTPYPDGNVPSIPHVPGFTPLDPKTNEPLKPVDPTDPSKGYVPPTPDESGIDTPIPYVQNGNVVVNYVAEDGTV
ncbi:TPA: MucBP domain-containing protein, partial [Streptococcus suis]